MRSLVRRSRVETELEKEIRFHLEQQIEENLAAGMASEEARYAAARRLGCKTQIEEECRDMRRTNLVENLMADLRYAGRTLARTPGFAVVIVLTLALSIGANSAIFSVIRGVLLNRLPYPQQDRVMRIFMSNAPFPKFPLNPFDFLDFRARNRTFGSMAIMMRSDVQLSGAGEPQRLSGFEVSAGYFRVLGLHPARGREFTTRDELKGSPHVVILSDRFWRTRFGADPSILGQKIRLDGLPFVVVGVMPPEMKHPGNLYRPTPYGDTVDVWSPFAFQGDPNQRGSHYIEGIGRLKDGVSVVQASADLNAVFAQIAREHPNSGDPSWHVLVIPIYREIVGASERLLLILLGAVGLVLLIACANAANVLLARATARQREMAVRSALGASGWRLVRQMLTESTVMAVLGGAAGAMLAIWGVKVLVSLLPAGFPRAHDIHIDGAVFAFALVTAVATGILFGLAPALQATRADLQTNLRSGRGATGTGRHLGLRNWLVIGELSLACMLLIGAGLMLRSFVNLLRTDPGFRPDHVLTAGISLPEETYKTPESGLRFYEELIRRVEVLPGVSAAGIGSDLPWIGYDDNVGGFDIEGKKPPPHEEFHARYHMASPGYFRAVGIPLVAGRFFRDGDRAKTPLVLIINRVMAQRYWPGENALGKRINFFNDHPKESDWTTVVGVVGDVTDTPEKRAAEPAFWWPVAQAPFSSPAGMMMAVRASSDPAALASALRRTVHDLDPTLALADVRSLDRIAAAGVSTPRFALFLIGLFAGLAITLAAVGIYGVISYSVSQRTQEFGMRVALGAQPRDVLGLVLSQGLTLASVGVAGGVLCSLALAHVLRSLLYEVSAVDPLTFAGVAVLALAVAAIASFVPACRATYADPVVALRAE
jgi:predicted permease